MDRADELRESLVIRPATLQDAEAIRNIYNHEVENSIATMDLVPRTLDEQQRWLADRSGAFSALVAVDSDARLRNAGGRISPGSPPGSLDGAVVGFAALSPYKERAAYRPTVEDSVYVHQSCLGRGIGSMLLRAVVDVAQESGFHSIIARISAPGEASRALHTSCGFREIGLEHEVGRKFNRWIDVIVMQRMLH